MSWWNPAANLFAMLRGILNGDGWSGFHECFVFHAPEQCYRTCSEKPDWEARVYANRWVRKMPGRLWACWCYLSEPSGCSYGVQHLSRNHEWQPAYRSFFATSIPLISRMSWKGKNVKSWNRPVNSLWMKSLLSAKIRGKIGDDITEALKQMYKKKVTRARENRKTPPLSFNLKDLM